MIDRTQPVAKERHRLTNTICASACSALDNRNVGEAWLERYERFTAIDTGLGYILRVYSLHLFGQQRSQTAKTMAMRGDEMYRV